MPITEVIKNVVKPNRFKGTPPDAKLADPGLGDLDDSLDPIKSMLPAERASMAASVSNADEVDVPESIISVNTIQ